MLQSCSGQNIAVNVTRAVSRLKTIFVTLDSIPPTGTDCASLVRQDFNSFDHPMEGEYNFTQKFGYQVQIGSKMIPEYPVRSLAQAFYELRKALGIASSPFHSISITADQYLDTHSIMGIDTERILEAGFTGINTRAGYLMTFRIKGANGNITTTLIPAKIYITLQSDQILELRDSGATIMD